MIRRLVFFLGFLLVAAGFVLAVIDGARWLATHGLNFIPFGTALGHVLGASRIAAIQPAVEQFAHPLLWRWIVGPFLSLPGCLVLAAAGFGLMWVARPPAPMIGFAPRP